MARQNVLRAGRVHYCFRAFDKLFIRQFSLAKGTLVNVLVAPGNSLLRRETVPQTITGQQNEIASGLERHYPDVGKRGDSLSIWLLVGTPLVLEITECSGKGKRAIDATLIDEAARCVDALSLEDVVRLVVLTQG